MPIQRNSKLQALSIGATVLTQAGQDVWGALTPGEKRTATRGLAQTITSVIQQPDDRIAVTCYEEDAPHRALVALDNLISADPTGSVPTAGGWTSNTEVLSWSKLVLLTPGGANLSQNPQLVTWIFAAVGLRRVALP